MGGIGRFVVIEGGGCGVVVIGGELRGSILGVSVDGGKGGFGGRSVVGMGSILGVVSFLR